MLNSKIMPPRSVERIPGSAISNRKAFGLVPAGTAGNEPMTYFFAKA